MQHRRPLLQPAIEFGPAGGVMHALKTLVLGSAVFTFTAACAEGEPVTVPFELPFSAVVGDAPFACDGSFNVGTSSAAVQPLDLRFYVHDVEVISGGEAVPVTLDDSPFQRDGLALIDLEDDSGTCETGSPETNAKVTGTVPEGTTVDSVRFVIGVPEEQNHLDAATGPAPLNVPGLWWSWAGGYKFMKIDVVAPQNPEFYFHLGATTCEGDPTAGFSCAFGNKATVDVAGASVVMDLAALYAGVDVNTPLAEGDSVPGCMAFAGDPECPAMFAPLGLDFESATASGDAQTLFKAGE